MTTKESVNDKDIVKKLKDLKELLDSGVLTNEEFEKVKCGLRPVSPDGLPYIGRSKKCKNLIIATGHAMMGWGMGTATGLVVSELLDNKKPSINIMHYNPDRKF